MAIAPSFEERRAHYRGQWELMKVSPSRVSAVTSEARKLLANRSRYERVEAKTGVPWYFIAALHNREASGSFAGVLHNGEKIIGTGRKTTLVPAGRGPFSSWEEAAIDALTMPPHQLNKITDWSIERMCYEAERYNGWGYWYRGDKSSAYLWAGTNIDGGGKFIADGVWSATTQDKQNGAMPIIRELCSLAGIALHFHGEERYPAPTPKAPEPQPAPTPIPEPEKAPKGERLLVAVLKGLWSLITGK